MSVVCQGHACINNCIQKLLQVDSMMHLTLAADSHSSHRLLMCLHCQESAFVSAANVILLLLQPASDLCKKCWDAGLIVITAGKGDVVRLVPPLVVSDDDIDKCIEMLSSIANQILV